MMVFALARHYCIQRHGRRSVRDYGQHAIAGASVGHDRSRERPRSAVLCVRLPRKHALAFFAHAATALTSFAAGTSCNRAGSCVKRTASRHSFIAAARLTVVCAVENVSTGTPRGCVGCPSISRPRLPAQPQTAIAACVALRRSPRPALSSRSPGPRRVLAQSDNTPRRRSSTWAALIIWPSGTRQDARSR
jgi:hypothetical protein